MPPPTNAHVGRCDHVGVGVGDRVVQTAGERAGREQPFVPAGAGHFQDLAIGPGYRVDGILGLARQGTEVLPLSAHRWVQGSGHDRAGGLGVDVHVRDGRILLYPGLRVIYRILGGSGRGGVPGVHDIDARYADSAEDEYRGKGQHGPPPSPVVSQPAGH